MRREAAALALPAPVRREARAVADIQRTAGVADTRSETPEVCVIHSWSRAARSGLVAVTLGLGLAPSASLGGESPAFFPPAAARDGSARSGAAIDPATDPLLPALSAAWAIPVAGLEERARRLQAAGSRFGLADLEGPAQALLLDPQAGPLLDRARAARRLAPELPAARAALARALWAEGEFSDAWKEFWAASRLASRHAESRVWLHAALNEFGWVAAAAIGSSFIALGLLCGFLPLTRRLAGVLGLLPRSARGATLGTLLLLPAAAGEGIFGTACAALALAVAPAAAGRRLALAAAALVLWVGLHPLLDRSAAARAELASASLFEAAQLVERGMASAVERTRIRMAAESDPLAGPAWALEERRRGLLEQAERRFEAWIGPAADPELLNNAASVKLARGEHDAAIGLLERAVSLRRDPVLLFNLSQVYGAAVRIEDQNSALAEGQALDADRVHELVASFGPGRIVDRPVRAVRGPTAHASRVSALVVGQALRRRLAPGRLGVGPVESAFGLAGGLAAGLVLGLFLRRSRPGEDDLATRIARLVQNRRGDSSERIRRLAELRAREAALARAEKTLHVLVPGLAGMRTGRSWLGLLGVAWAAVFVTAGCLHGGPVPPPLALGSWPDLWLPWILVIGLLGHAAWTGLAIAWRPRR